VRDVDRVVEGALKSPITAGPIVPPAEPDRMKKKRDMIRANEGDQGADRRKAAAIVPPSWDSQRRTPARSLEGPTGLITTAV